MKASPSSSQADLPLSAYIRDPFVREAFQRAERDQGQAPAAVAANPAPNVPRLAGGAAAAPETREAANA